MRRRKLPFHGNWHEVSAFPAPSVAKTLAHQATGTLRSRNIAAHLCEAKKFDHPLSAETTMREKLSAALAAIVLLAAGNAADAGAAFDVLNERPAAEIPVEISRLVNEFFSCPAALDMMYMGERPGGAEDMWTVRCKGGDYLIAIKNTDPMTSKVVPCEASANMKKLCWTKIKP